MIHETSFASLLAIGLGAAVPLICLEIKQRGGPTEEDRVRARAAAEILGAKGDILQFGGGKKGEVAAVFGAVAFGIAVAAFSPGGIRAFGEHYAAIPACGRAACRRDAGPWWNTETRAWYCHECAEKINAHAPRALVEHRPGAYPEGEP